MTIHNERDSEFLTPTEWIKVIRELELTPRETDIVKLLLPGPPDKEIANALGVSTRTVCSHLRQIYAKHRLRGRVALVSRIHAICRND
jgi:DNA-binding NarL/FixJ family response regulator